MTNIERAASAIVSARQARVQIPALSGELAPASVEEAYAIQDASMRLLGPLGGWKLAIGADLSCSPMPAQAILPTPAKLLADRPYKIEAEVGIMIGQDLEEQQSADTIRAAIASVHPAIELVLSRFSGPAPKVQGLADCQSNEAVIVGTAIDGWAGSGPASSRMALSIGGETVAANSDGVWLEAMLAPLAWLANHARARGLPLRKGHFIITGARLKAPAPGKPCSVAVEVGGYGQAVFLELV
jgi:2-keto-4-pentenoate hydratase